MNFFLGVPVLFISVSFVFIIATILSSYEKIETFFFLLDGLHILKH